MAKRKPSIDQELAAMSGPPRHEDDEGPSFGEPGSLTAEGVRAVRDLVNETCKLKIQKEALTDTMKAVAAKLQIKPAELNEMINIIIKEEEKGGVLEEKERKLEFTRSVLEAVAQHGGSGADSDE